MSLAGLTHRLKSSGPATGEAGGLDTAISTLVSQTRRLVELEIMLARQELKALLKRNAIAAGMLAVGALGGLMFLIIGQVWLILVLPRHALSAGIIAGLWLIGGAALGLLGKARLKIAPPKATLESLKEDLEWVKQQIKHAGS
jgi:uncharacterized membrane protein YqjE